MQAGVSDDDQRNPAIQYLRAVAALSVLLYHATFYLALIRGDSSLRSVFNDNVGIFGVALFFAISGYLMARIAPVSRPAFFFLHRIARIYPLYLIVAVSVFFLKFSTAYRIDFDPFAFALIPGGPRGYVLGTDWTLPFELAFYVVVFAAIGAGLARQLPLLAVVWLAAIGVSKWLLPPALQTYDIAMAYPPLSLLLISYASVGFVCGLFVPWVIARVPAGWRILLPGIALVGLGCLYFPYTLALMGAGGACLVAVAASTRLSFRSQLLERLGDWSYALYLVHVPVVLLVYHILPGPVPGLAAWSVAVFVSIACSAALGTLDVKLYRRLKRCCDGLSVAAATALSAVFLVGFLSASLYWDLRQRHTHSKTFTADSIGSALSTASAGDLSIENRAALSGLRPSNELVGFDRIADLPAIDLTIFAGWAVDATYADQAPLILFFVNRKYVGFAVPIAPRPDVVRELKLGPQASSTIGFHATLTTAVCKLPAVIETLIVSGNRYASIRNPSFKPDCSGRP
jgi:peptidoglycan/LPS O-acetylase OafA/YrhL